MNRVFWLSFLAGWFWDDLVAMLPLLVIECAAAVFWRWVVVEGRWFGAPEAEIEDPTEALNEMAAVLEAHQATLDTLTQRVMELEQDPDDA